MIVVQVSQDNVLGFAWDETMGSYHQQHIMFYVCLHPCHVFKLAYMIICVLASRTTRRAAEIVWGWCKKLTEFRQPRLNMAALSELIPMSGYSMSARDSGSSRSVQPLYACTD